MVEPKVNMFIGKKEGTTDFPEKKNSLKGYIILCNHMNPVGFIYRNGTDVQYTTGITAVFKPS